MNRKNLILLELNEVNFEFVARYVAQGHLPTLGALIARHGVTNTTSEADYENLEPWIQWVTAHTGLSYSQHGIYRLGDIAGADIDQIWETLERRGISVGAISPMNAKNRCRGARFFLPDPWTPTSVTGSKLIARLHAALAQVVSENAQGRISASSAIWLLLSLLRFGRLRSLPSYFRYALRARSRPWSKALFLDRFLADLMINRWKAVSPEFCSLFLNAAAHIQHHYMFSSAVYEGPHRNPSWYAKPGADPLLEVYRVYDAIAADLLKLQPDLQLIIATGLHQDPCPNPVYYYRLRNHQDFLNRLGVEYQSVLPLMSRDFTFECRDRTACEVAARQLSGLRSQDGLRLFDAEARDSTVFAMLTYPAQVTAPIMVADCNGAPWDISRELVFVALKNGVHNGIGYLVDTGIELPAATRQEPLGNLHNRILGAFASGATGTTTAN